jgi:malate dehydrogenase (oxaloacetate-decarboxylating)(NADP+)
VQPGKDFELVNPNSDPRFRDYWQLYYNLMMRKGVSEEVAKREVIRRTTLIGALMVRQGEADALLCGTYGEHTTHLNYISNVIGLKPGVRQFAAMNLLLLQGRTVFICDTYVNPEPTPEQLAEITVLAAQEVQRFGLAPKIALLSHSSFGSARTPSAWKMSRVRELLEQTAPHLEVEGEMHGDAALSEEIRMQVFPQSRLKGEANLLIMPTLDAANISFNLLKVIAGEGITVGPILLGAAAVPHRDAHSHRAPAGEPDGAGERGRRGGALAASRNEGNTPNRVSHRGHRRRPQTAWTTKDTKEHEGNPQAPDALLHGRERARPSRVRSRPGAQFFVSFVVSVVGC